MKLSGTVLASAFVIFPLTLITVEAEAQNTDLRDVPEFDSIVVANGLDVEIRQGDAFRVEIMESPADARSILTEVTGTTLEIRRDQRSQRFFGLFEWFAPNPTVEVTLPSLESISSLGGSNVRTTGVITGPSLTVKAVNGSDVEIEVRVDTLQVTSSGGSDVRLAGTADSATLETSGGSDLSAADFTAREVYVQTSGGSDAVFTVNERVVGSASGGSDIIYRGNPAVVDVDVSGGADVTPL